LCLSVQIFSNVFRGDVPLDACVTLEATEHGALAEQLVLFREGQLSVGIDVQKSEDQTALLTLEFLGRAQPLFLKTSVELSWQLHLHSILLL
jgi:hypothetical protein